MKHNVLRRKSKTNTSVFIFGMLFSIAVFFLLALIAAFILSKVKNPLGAAAIASIIILILSGAISGFAISKYSGRKTVLPSFFCAVIFALILFSAGLIISDGKIATVTVINLLVYILFSFIFALLASKEKKRRIKR